MHVRAPYRSTWREFLAAVSLQRFGVAAISCLAFGLLGGLLLTSSGADRDAVLLGVGSSLLLILPSVLIVRFAVLQGTGRVAEIRRLETDLHRLEFDLKRYTPPRRRRTAEEQSRETTKDFNAAIAYLTEKYDLPTAAQESLLDEGEWDASEDERIALKLQIGRLLATAASEAVNEAIEETSALSDSAPAEQESQELRSR